VREYKLNIANWPASMNGLKVAVITDLHAGSLYVGPGKVRQVVEETNKANPDVVVLLGDYVASVHKYCPIKPAAFMPELAKLKARYGVYAVLGNHDWWYNGDEIFDAMTAEHLKVLENSASEINIGKERLWIAGLADKWTRIPSVDKALKQIPEGDPILVITHNPDVFPSIPKRVSLTMAGHTHGGQVAIPGIGPLFVPSAYGTKYARGHIVEDGRHLFVSTGIGTTFLPARLCTPPEISLLILSQ